MEISKYFNKIVSLLLAILVLMFFLGFGAFGGDELWSSGKIIGSLEILMVAFLLLNYKQLQSVSFPVVVVFLWILWMLLTIAFFEAENFVSWLNGGLLAVLFWPCVYLFYFANVKYYRQSIKDIVFYFFIISILCCILFFLVFDNFNSGKSTGLKQLNVVYFPLLTFPWVVLVRKTVWRYLAIGLIGLAVLFSLKRAAFFAYTLSLIIYIIVEYFLISKRYSFRNILVPCIIIFFSITGFFIIDNILDGAFSNRLVLMESDEGSGRTGIYEDVINVLKDEPIEALVIGNGHYSAEKIIGITAHNDFLEVLFDYGIIGILLYLALHISLVMRVYSLIAKKSLYASAFSASYVLFFIMSMISHLIIYPSYFVFLAAFWGAVEGKELSDKRFLF